MTVLSNDIVNIPVSNNVINRAAETSLKKLPYLYRGFINSRTLKKRLENSFQGDVAKLALMENLESNGRNVSDDFDVVRTDNFMQPMNRAYHFIMDEIRIESNSSKLPPRITAINDTNLLNMDIKISHSEGRNTFPLFVDYDMAVQMYFEIEHTEEIFVFEDIDNAINYLTDTNENINRRIEFLLSCLNVDLLLYFFAFIDENNLRDLPYFSGTWTFPNSERNYYKCKIKDCEPYSNL
ncbi:hypothetical protein [Vagococcus sp. CY53-2]|uniref:hypothetical protein n=1 Tax=Vagococcus sp. CY53-2 TaxID=2925780 RepID=UPI001F50589A|nr:hypothetical protein [Vagococcus sp. CY53-2]MCI0130032.1 hypothetical protein [Vagococcus sp. CY53-2]